MRRGTTPTNVFKTNVNLAGATVFISYAQKGEVIVEKTNDDVDIHNECLSTRLTQEDTLKLDSRQKVNIQIRYVFPDGTAGASNIITVDVGDILKDGEITP